jgi:uncharacterized membrane protein YozB (DUF420 family)
MPATGRLAGHIRLLAILWFALSAFAMLPGLFLLTMSGFLASVLPPEVPAFVAGLFPAIGIVFIALAGIGCIAGWGLLERAPWARMLTIVLACFSLLHMPFGTALGIYTLWVLLPAQSEAEYRQASVAHGFEARA